MSDEPLHPVSECCTGRKCDICHRPAAHKVEEVIFDDDPDIHRHPLTTYLCCPHFVAVMGNAAPCRVSAAPL
jgi:hypothetical protein